MTGSRSFAAFAGVQTFSERQSSLIEGTCVYGLAACTHPGPKLSACFTPDQGCTRCGAFQRSAPTGGAANGIPLNDTMPCASAPATRPPVTSASRTCADDGRAHTRTATANMTVPVKTFIMSSRIAASNGRYRIVNTLVAARLIDPGIMA